MSINPLSFYNHLKSNDINFFCGVPDSLLKQFCLCLDDKVDKKNHIITPNEGHAIALAAGFYLGTRQIPLVYMQNSGIGNAINPLLSLCDPDVYGIPMIILIGWRGEPGVKDEPQHVKQGKIQLELTSALDISFDIITKNENNFENKIKNGVEVAIMNRKPYIFYIKKEVFSTYKNNHREINNKLMSREEALRVILSQLPNDVIIISTTGKTSREIFEIRVINKDNHSHDFLTVGSMGHCSSIALGLAISNPEKKIVCIDGDGSFLMHMGIIATIGDIAPANFYHILINNFVHESVGGQETSIQSINIKMLIESSNYENFSSVNDLSSLKEVLSTFTIDKGPNFLEIVIKPGSRNNLGRPTITPLENKKLFMKNFNKNIES